jgi:hypothetical protein
MTADEIGALGHEPTGPLQAIRAKCLDCCAGSAHEVRCCVAVACPSWPFRTGKNPWRAPPSEAQRSHGGIACCETSRAARRSNRVCVTSSAGRSGPLHVVGTGSKQARKDGFS